MTEDGDAQLHAETVRVPAMIFTFHRLPLGGCGEKKVCQQGGFRAIGLPAERNVLRGSACIISDIKISGWGFLLAGTDSGDAYTFSQYEKMFGNAGFVKTTQHSVPDSTQQLLLWEK